jgi:hypothetical protein
MVKSKRKTKEVMEEDSETGTGIMVVVIGME